MNKHMLTRLLFSRSLSLLSTQIYTFRSHTLHAPYTLAICTDTKRLTVRACTTSIRFIFQSFSFNIVLHNQLRRTHDPNRIAIRLPSIAERTRTVVHNKNSRTRFTYKANLLSLAVNNSVGMSKASV